MAVEVAQEKRTFEIGLLNSVEILSGWNLLYFAIMMSGLYGPMEVVQMLHDAMLGKVQLWLLKGRTEKGPEPLGVIGSQIYFRPYSKVKAFSLIHAGAVEHIEDDEWIATFQQMMRYAKGEGCDIFEIFSDNPRVHELMERFGFKQHGLFVREV